VSLNQACSTLKHIGYGVPQGLSLGPLLFLISICLPNALNSELTLFADDTFLIVQANTPETLQIKINVELNSMSGVVPTN